MNGGLSNLFHLLGEPAAWLAGLLNLPANPYWAPYVAVVFFFVTLSVAWWSFSFWRQHKYFFYLLLYVVLLALGIIGYLVIILYPNAWVYGALSSLVGLVMVWRIVTVRQFNKALNRDIRRLTFTGLMISVVLPALLFFHYQFAANRLYAALDHQLQDQTSALQAKTKAAAAAADEISQDTFLITQLQQGQTAGLTTSLQQSMLEKGLTFVTLTNPLATVLARAHQPLVFGDNLFEQMPWIAPVFKGDKVSGVAFNEKGIPVVGAAVSVTQDKRLGVIVAGYTLSDQYCREESGRLKQSVAIGTDAGLSVNCSLNARQDRVLSSAQLADILKTSAKQNRAIRAAFTAGTEQYLTLTQPLSTLEGGQMVVLAGIRQNTQPSWLPIADSVAVILLTIVLIFLSERFSKRRHD